MQVPKKEKTWDLQAIKEGQGGNVADAGKGTLMWGGGRRNRSCQVLKVSLRSSEVLSECQGETIERF